MKYFIFSLVAFTAFTACKRKSKVPPPASATPVNMSLVIGNPVDYGFPNLIIFPVGANYNPAIKEAPVEDRHDKISTVAVKEGALAFVQNTYDNKIDRSSSNEYINTSENDFDIRNILFYDKSTGQSRPLFSDTLHILSFAIHKEFSRPMIFFRIVKRDVNKDKKYNSADAIMLYVSDLDGKNFTQITPENEQFFDYFYYPETQTILVKTALDIDQSNSFTNLDETNFREMKIKNPRMGREIFSKSLKDSLKAQMNVLP